MLYTLLTDLHRIQGFYTIGRHGLFVNNSMDDNVEMGIRVAANIADGNSRDTWWQQVLTWTQLVGVASQ